MKTTGWLLLACFLAAAPVQARPAAVDLAPHMPYKQGLAPACAGALVSESSDFRTT